MHTKWKKERQDGPKGVGSHNFALVGSESALANEGSQCREDVYVASL